MNREQLHELLYTETENEKKYKNEGASAVSTQFLRSLKKKVHGQDVIMNSEDLLKQELLFLRRDSRYLAIPPFVYTNVDINYIYSGTCTYTINGQKLRLNAGDVCIFDKGVILEKQPAQYHDIIIHILISDEAFRRIMPEENQNIITEFLIAHLTASSGQNNYIVFQTKEDPVIQSLFESLMMEYYGGQSYSKEIALHYLAVIILELLRHYEQTKDIRYVHIADKSYSKMLAILCYIENNYKTCTLTSIADAFGYHEKYICSFIKKNCGKNLRQLKREIRLKKAVDYLKNSDLPIYQIAEETGYTNRTQFYKEFAQMYHVLPSVVRSDCNGPMSSFRTN